MKIQNLDFELLNKIPKNWIINKKLIIQEEIREEPCSQDGKYDFCEFGDCQRCSCNDGVDVNTLKISPINSKEKIVFERICSHQIGCVWGNWYVVH